MQPRPLPTELSHQVYCALAIKVLRLRLWEKSKKVLYVPTVHSQAVGSGPCQETRSPKSSLNLACFVVGSAALIALRVCMCCICLMISFVNVQSYSVLLQNTCRKTTVDIERVLVISQLLMPPAAERLLGYAVSLLDSSLHPLARTHLLRPVRHTTRS